MNIAPARPLRCGRLCPEVHRRWVVSARGAEYLLMRDGGQSGIKRSGQSATGIHVPSSANSPAPLPDFGARGTGPPKNIPGGSQHPSGGTRENEGVGQPPARINHLKIFCTPLSQKN